MSAASRYGRGTIILLLAVSYALLAHYTNANHNETLGALVALTPIVLAILTMAWHSSHRLVMLTAIGGACALLLASWGKVAHHFNQIYWVEHAGSQLVLCMVFGRTLFNGREPMCTYFAKVVHGTITLEIALYSRKVTVAWVIFFGMMSSTSTIIFFTCPLPVWSAFAYFFTAPLIGLMFVVEYGVRRMLQPHMQHAHILAAITAVWQKQTQARAPKI